MPRQVGNTTLIDMTSSCMVGTKGYFPPEYMDGKYGPKGDVYAYGIVSGIKIYHILIDIFCSLHLKLTLDNWLIQKIVMILVWYDQIYLHVV